MPSTHTKLDAASIDRKARLANLASLKRKQPEADAQESTATENGDEQIDGTSGVTSKYLSGRNYDIATRGPRLGFENAPNEGETTLEELASKIALETAEAAKADEEVDKPIDLFKLQPKKPNWDLKRDLDEKMKVLNVRTENAIARLVRDRIQNAQKAAKEKAVGGGENGEEVGIEGATLVEGVHAREREEADQERREREEVEALG
ncbi:hypothetical protein AJ80_04228 [Polytolypa hystricis UAMH7299]|uniref:Pre-mRNA-splicing factor cwf18 n=1 Tax=Polytolypa hystricis (strain UAMH7299) TaxID=1447883 RepID=A0A2B7YE18_POLH7|nr:hypothetical protein AJ80_04228 [Polytolypa hystricis UAMH7299]